MLPTSLPLPSPLLQRRLSRNLPRRRRRQTHLHRRLIPERRTLVRILLQFPSGAGQQIRKGIEQGGGREVCERGREGGEALGCREAEGDVGIGAGEDGRSEGDRLDGEEEGGGAVAAEGEREEAEGEGVEFVLGGMHWSFS